MLAGPGRPAGAPGTGQPFVSCAPWPGRPRQQRRPGSAAPCLVVRRIFRPLLAGNRAAGRGRDRFCRMRSPDTVRSRRVRARPGPAGSPRPVARLTARHRTCGLRAPGTSATAPRPRPETSPDGSSDAGTPAGRPAHAWPRCRRSRSHPPQPLSRSHRLHRPGRRPAGARCAGRRRRGPRPQPPSGPRCARSAMPRPVQLVLVGAPGVAALPCVDTPPPRLPRSVPEQEIPSPCPCCEGAVATAGSRSQPLAHARANASRHPGRRTVHRTGGILRGGVNRRAPRRSARASLRVSSRASLWRPGVERAWRRGELRRRGRARTSRRTRRDADQLEQAGRRRAVRSAPGSGTRCARPGIGGTAVGGRVGTCSA